MLLMVIPFEFFFFLFKLPVTMRDIREFTNIMAEDNDEFIVLYAPEKINGITFLQDGILVKQIFV